ncbi:hypothetical protein ISN45_At03g022050 [Arabidopsis thaliana x Arabidopsis arenosa]|uniref:Retrovirus-related Pol polyprotein from transposon TNT 1-94-like beta-barrel domain-containing protein n=1 Tax=Arabidopsis thaliana x Arabidopsis arenosa TaxID=1240361 RepID=A0A8T2EQ12_9BRAS|nr:hypothetical protein ISN45_At03g022050 [Arabidopsis thaliana x Arabidopsis arenosa]
MIMKGDWSATTKPNLQDIISDDLNMEVWSAMLKIILTEEGLWDVVANGVPPDPSKIPKLAATIQAEELCKWRELAREDMKALQILQSSLTDSVFRKTLSATSAKDLWDMLNEVPDHVAECLVDDSPVYEDSWRISCSNSNHITSHEKFFTTLDRSRKARIRFTNGSTTMAEGTGDVTIMTQEGKKTIKNVLYAPGLVGNALSVSQMLRSGLEARMDRERCTIWDRTAGKSFAETKMGERGFHLRLDVIDEERTLANGIPPDPSKNPKLAATIQAEDVSKWREFVRKDMEALEILQFSLPDSVFRKTLSAVSAKDLWDLLNEVPDHVAECFSKYTFHENIWLISSTNSNHMTPHVKFFTTLDRSRKCKVKFISGDKSETTVAMVEGIGDVTFITNEGNKTIKNVLHVPGIEGNALSVSQLKRNGFEVSMERRTGCFVWDRTTGKMFGKNMWEKRGFCLRFSVIEDLQYWFSPLAEVGK